MQHDHIGGRIVSGQDPRPAAGQRRMRQIAIEATAEITTVTNEFLAGLGREPTMAEKIQAEMIASVFVRSRRKRSRGQCDARERNELQRLLRASVFRPMPRVTKQADTPSVTA